MATAPAVTRITRSLYMGSKRVLNDPAFLTGKPSFDIYVSTAKEVKPPRSMTGAFESIWIKMDDIPWRFKQDQRTIKRLVETTGVIAALVKQRHRVVIFCHMGMNRSGFITALTLMHLGWSLQEALAKIRTRHHCALSNQSFVRALAYIEEMYF
jgi:hypothetical protein